MTMTEVNKMTKADRQKKGKVKRRTLKKAKSERASTRIRKKQFVENYFKLTGNVSELCRRLGISRQTYYEWMEKDQEFRKAIENEQEGLIDFVENKLFALINGKNPAAIFFFLKTKAKHRGYVEQWEHKHSGEVKYELSEKFIPEAKRKEDESDKPE